MANLADISHEDETADNEVESPVDGPTPDWMRLATSASNSGSSLTEEKTPDWLKKIRSGQRVTQEPKPAEIKSTQSSTDAMSDLERLLADEGIDLNTVAEERPADAGGMSARDWLIATSSDELIRKQVGAGPVEPESASPTPSPAQSSTDTMSDLERLLAEEGIDLNTVTEDRPVDAGNMSARDWLIATSSDELIRKQVGAGPVEPEPLPAAPPPVAPATPPPTPIDADKMVVQEDLPDWLRDYSTETDQFPATLAMPPTPVTAPEPEFDQFVVQDELPDWLQEIAEEASGPVEPEPFQPDFTEPTPAKLAASTGLFDEDKMVVEEDLPDWLREFAAEEPVAVAPEAIPPIQTPKAIAHPSAPAFEDKMIVEEDLPDWLREMAEEPSPGIEAGMAASPTLGQLEAETDLPDWLRQAEEVSPEPILPFEETGVESSTVGLDILPVEDEEEFLPDWLREVEETSLERDIRAAVLEPAAEPITETSFDLEEEEELPDWLREAQERESQPMPVETLAPSITAKAVSPDFEPGLVVEDELPDWLREVQEEPGPTTFELVEPEIEPMAVRAGEIEEESLPDWLRKETEEIFEPSEPSPEPFTDVYAEEELAVEEELPDWLQEVEAELPEMSVKEEAAIPVAPIIAGVVSLEEEDIVVVEEELPDWLREVEPEIEAEPTPLPLPEPALTEPEIRPLPEPIMMPAAQAPAAVEPVIAAEPAMPIAAEAAALIEEISPPAAVVEPAVTPMPGEIPDWLQKLREVQVEEEPPLLAVPPTLATRQVYAVPPVPLPPPAAPARTTALQIELPPDAIERLGQARTARDKGAIEEAVRLYESLVGQGIFLDKIIEDMQQTIKTHPTNYLLHQLMGDAMARDGRLQSALNAYREAMTKL